MKYTMTVNGAAVPMQEARVSAIPFNTVWPGHQRPVSQTEMAYFASFTLEDAADIQVTVLDADIQSVELRPACADTTVAGNTVRFTLTHPQNFSFEVNGFHEALHIFANPPMHYTLPEDAIVYGPGVHYAGLISPKSNQTIYIDEGAVVYGAIFAKDADNIRILGRGVLDSSPYERGIAAKLDQPEGEIARGIRAMFPEDTEPADRAGNCVFYHCTNVYMEGVILKDSMFWSLITRNDCRNVVIDNIKIIGQWRYNADGVDLCNTTDCVLKNSFIRAFDDCVVIRAPYLNGESGCCKNNVVENNVLWCDWGKSLEIWFGHTDGVVENIVFRNNDLIRLSHMAMDITTWYGSDHIRCSGVVYEDLRVYTDAQQPCPVYQDTEDMVYEEKPYTPDLMIINCTKMGRMTDVQQFVYDERVMDMRLLYENVVMRNIRCLGRPLPVKVMGMPPVLTIRSLRLENVDASQTTVSGDVTGVVIQ